MIFKLPNSQQKHEEYAKEFCIQVSREFGVRSKHFSPANPQERRWLAEGMVPLLQFETVADMVAGAMQI